MDSRFHQNQNMPENYLQEIAAATLADGGVAFKLDTCQFLPPMDIWAFPKYPSRTVILPSDVNLVEALQDFVLANEPFFREPDCWLGTWIHPQTREFYLDITTSCTDLDNARKMAFEVSRREGRKIVAIFNSKRKLTVYL
jgi:hypothetical protein